MKTLLRFLICCALLPPMARSGAGQVNEKKLAVPRIEVCFVLDTTGSMGGLLEGAKQKIWSIANDLVSARPTPDLRLGLVAYRDKRDEYVLKSYDLTNDIDAVYANLKTFTAGGGGDMPESVNEALHEATTKMSWTTNRSVLKIIFLVGDAPPHMDYHNAPKYPEVCQDAMKRDLIVNTIQCGGIRDTTPIWKEIAKLSEGSYAAIAQEGGMMAIATPMDEKLAELNRKVGNTLVAYGSERARREVMAKQTASEVAPASVAADRLSFNSSVGRTVQGKGELLDALAAGELKVADIKKDQLPSEWQGLSETELSTRLATRQKERVEIQAEIGKLNRERDRYIAVERRKSAATGDSFDSQVAKTIRSQAARKGIAYGKD